MAWVIRLVEELDLVPAQYFQKMANTEEIWEIRTSFGGNSFRLLGFLHGPRFVVLVHGFRKKTMQTPSREIRTAEERRRDYLQRMGEGK